MDVKVTGFLTSLQSEDLNRGSMRTLPQTNFEVKTTSGPGFSVLGTSCTFYGYICTSSSALNVSLYHGSNSSGTLITSTTMTVNDKLLLPIGLAMPNGLYVNFNSGSGSLIILAI